MKYPSKEFPDWLTYIEWWGLPNMAGFGYLIVDDVTGTKKTTVTDAHCFKGGNVSSAIKTAPWVGFIAIVTAAASIY